MNQRLNISDLAELLAEYTGKDKKYTELFLRELISVVSDALLEEHIVKVKGLGTFKVIQVEERESIHVNTGERFLIPAHSRFTFTPDKDLKEQVNRPFASFEATELNEGVEFTATSDEVAQDDEPEDIDEENETFDVTEEMEESLKQEPEAEQKNEQNSEPVAENEELKEEEKEIPQPEAVQSEPETEESEEPEQAEQQEPVIIKTEQSKEQVVSVEKETDGQPKKSNWFLYFLLLVLFICFSGGFYYYYTNYVYNKRATAVAKEQPVVNPAIPADSVVVEPDSVVAEEPETIAAPVEVPQKEIIVEKIVPDSRLTLIALKHYGHKVFWVYIYEHNKAIIDNPNNIQIGTELIIPDASLYGIDAKNPESVAKAKAKQAEINTKF